MGSLEFAKPHVLYWPTLVFWEADVNTKARNLWEITLWGEGRVPSARVQVWYL